MLRTRWAATVVLVASAGHAATVRSDRPRLLLAPDGGVGTTLAEFRTRCTSDPAYQGRCQGAISAGGGLFPAISLAAGYVVNDDAAACSAAVAAAQTSAADDPGQPDGHSFISNHGRTMAELSVVRDWCDPVLSDPEVSWLETRMVEYADWYLAYPDLDVFHDDMFNAWTAVGLAALALKGTAYDARADTYLAAAEQQYKTVIFPALAHVGDWWHEGFTYVQPSLGSVAWFTLAWTTATDEDMYAWAGQNAQDLINGYLAFHAYALRPDGRYVYFGDTSSNKQSVELFSRYLVDMLTLGTGSTLGQGLSLEIARLSRPGYDYAGDNGWMYALFYDTSRDATATALSELPTSRWLSQGAQDVAVMRSGWGADDTYVWMTCGDYLGAHQHIESGSFQIFRHAPLTGKTGCYDAFDSDHWQNYYSQHSVHANTLAVHQPGEFFPTLQSLGDPGANVNDGGQRVLRRNHQGTGFPNPDLATYLDHKSGEPFTETGDLLSFEHGDCHDYVACDVTAAYSSPGYETNGNGAKVTEVSRQLVFLRPDLVVVFDRVEAVDPAYDKRFLLHAMAAPDVQAQQYTITNGTGRLVGTTLLPAQADVSVIEDFEVEGTAHPPSSFDSCDEPGGTRLEVSPPQEQARDYFLHAFQATSSTESTVPVWTSTEDAATATASITTPAGQYAVTFAKTGELGGHVTVWSADGSVLCDQDLGDFATGGAGGTGAGGGSGATAGSGPSGGGTAGSAGAAGGSPPVGGAPGTGAVAGVSAASGASAAAGTPTLGGGAGTPGAAASFDDEGGCGCSTPTQRGSARVSLLALLLAGLGAGRRRQQR